MNPIVRFIIAVLRASSAPRIGIEATGRVRMCVFPNDLDLNLHMTNARYLALLDIAGVEFVIRVGLGRLIINKGLRPLIAGRLVRHRFSLRPFEGFTVTTRLLWWDDKWFYFDQRMETARGIAVIVLTKGLIYDHRGAQTMRPDEVLNLLGLATPAGPQPPEVVRWLAAEEALHIEDAC